MRGSRAVRLTPRPVAYTDRMDDARFRAEQLLTLSSGARRLADLIAAAEGPVRYEVLRHLLRVSEETMSEILEEAVHVRLVRRTDDPFMYVPWDEALGEEIRSHIAPERAAKMRAHLAGAAERVFGD